MTTEEKDLQNRYVYQVTRCLPKAQREEVRMELEELIGDMYADKGSMEAVLTQLGDPARFAEQYRSGREDYRGYDRGHICASNDRKFTVEANVQTFYYSNMSPQYGNFNRGIWQRLEALVQDWGRNPSLRDTLYVVKGGTIDSDHIITYTGPSSVPVPAYYYMALVNVKKGIYSAIAFLLEHKDDYRAPYNLQDYAITVDELETFTGLDFFHNLPDACESRIEAQLVKDNWPGLFD